MTSYPTRLRTLFDQIDTTPWGPAERALVAQAVALAQESGDERLEYEARMRQTASANMTGDTDLMLTSFAWCLAHHDTDPTRFPAVVDPAGDLMWQFKWMAGALRDSPEFASEQIAAVLDDMEEHYRRAGIGPSGVLMARFEDAWSAGRIAEATALQERLAATPRDDYSHCDACVRSNVAAFFAETGREEAAMGLVQEMLEGGFSCGEEPERALGRILLPYLRAGRLDEARTAHLRSYRLARENPANLAIIADNVVFCAVTGNEARALALVERHLPWLVHDGLDAAAHETALASFAIALDAVAVAGHPDAPVRGSDAEDLATVFGPHEGPWRAAELARRAWDEAERIAARFDARNGTDAHAGALLRLRESAAVRYDVPIRSHEFGASPVAAPAQTPRERIERALALASAASVAAIPAIEAALPDATDEEAVTLSSHLVAALVSADRIEDATTALAERLRVLRRAGHDAQADLEQRRGLVLFGAELEASLPLLRADLDELGERHDEVRADLLLTLAMGLLWSGAHGEAAICAHRAAALFAGCGDLRRSHGAQLLEVDALAAGGELEQAREAAEALIALEGLDDGRRARALATRAQLRGGAEEYEAGAADADESTRLLLAIGADDRTVADAFFLAGALHEDAGEPAAAVSRYRVAAERREAAGLGSIELRYRLGRAMLSSGLSQEAVDVLDEVLRDESEASVEPASLAVTAGLLARAYAASGDIGTAIGAWGYAAELQEEAGEAAGRAFALVERGRLLGRVGAVDEALESFAEAAGLVRGDDEQVGLLAEALHLLAQAHQQRGDDEAFTVLDEALTLGRAHEADWFVADVLDTRARLLVSRDRVEEAVACALQASDGFAATGDLGGAASAELVAARALRDAGREADAVALYRAAWEHAADVAELQHAAALELGDVLEQLGRHGEAADIRATLPA
ncbi:hypothetical protein [Microbacterium sp. SORGH_AS_0888]|uniref:hypothetical protein n=1 Tax=Microbacterium sp. SORGH_AS_0888 TaxID=3041791 RepID=UPI00277F0147|nr:hypothetical protein [Microbacterium sp. SORGH_AS_0888]MDQ1130759.1 tetratricopeptide (TPR) repeat protein [Microbacterium sp. SORGH_AS_0888]